MVRPPEPTTEQLRAQQSEREQEERGRVEHASSAGEERAARRRAAKAGYLKQKLDEQVASEEPGNDGGPAGKERSD